MRRVTIEVQDNGVGMTTDVLGRVFEPFFTTKENGTGLGLSTAQQIARDLGGEITVESRVGAGTTFTLWLPMLDSAEPRPAPLTVPPLRTGRDAVLLVEDEPELRNLVKIVLAEAGYQVMVGPVARRPWRWPRAASRSICLVTDVVMPEMSGRSWPSSSCARGPRFRCSICRATSATR